MAYTITNLSGAELGVAGEIIPRGGVGLIQPPTLTPLMIQLQQAGLINYTGYDDPTPTGLDQRLARVEDSMVSLSQFGITPGVECSAQLQAAINSAYDAGDRAIFVPPTEGGYLLHAQNPITIYEGMHLKGVYGKSLFKRTGTTLKNKPTFPDPRIGMFALARRDTGMRYGTETSRLPSGTGATFNLTINSGVVTAATVVNGGTGYKVGDWSYLDAGKTIRFKVATVVANRGAIATVTVDLGGTNVTLTNPASQVSSLGQALYDRVLDPTTMAVYVGFEDLVLDGQWGFDAAMLTGPAGTGGQYYPGINIYGCKSVFAKGLRMFRFPNTGLLTVDVSEAVVRDFYSHDMGWRGVFGTSRNGLSNTGVYLTDPSCRDLNTKQWINHNIVSVDTGDVGVQYAFIGGLQASNIKIVGAGTIAIEGEASGFDVDDTFATNGGVVIPADAVFTNVFIDGTMQKSADGTQHYATVTTTAPGDYSSLIGLDGITWNCGNEGILDWSNVRVQNMQRFGFKTVQLNNGDLRLRDVVLDKCNVSTNSGLRQQPMYLDCRNIRMSNIEVLNFGSNSAISIQRAVETLEMTNITCAAPTTSIGGSTAPNIYVKLYKPDTMKRITMSNIRCSRHQGRAITIESANGGSNIVLYDEIDIRDVMVFNGGRNSSLNGTTLEIISTSGAKLDARRINVQNVAVVETSTTGHTLATDPVIVITPTVVTAPTQITVTGIVAPQYDVKTSIATSIAPISLRVTNNTTEGIFAKTGATTLGLESDNGRTFTNEGATAIVPFILPTAPAAPLRAKYSFIVQDADGIRVTAASGDTIRDGASVSAAAGKIESTTIGSSITLESINTVEWIITAKQGTWTVT